MENEENYVEKSRFCSEFVRYQLFAKLNYMVIFGIFYDFNLQCKPDPAGIGGIWREAAGSCGKPRDPAGSRGIRREAAGSDGKPRDPAGTRGIRREPAGSGGNRRDPAGTRGIRREPRVSLKILKYRF